MNFEAVCDTLHHLSQCLSGVPVAQVTVWARPLSLPSSAAFEAAAQGVDVSRAPHVSPARLEEVRLDRPLGVDDGQRLHQVLPVKGHPSTPPLVEPGNHIERLGVESRLFPRGVGLGGRTRLGLTCLRLVDGTGRKEHVLAVYGLHQLLLLLLLT